MALTNKLAAIGDGFRTSRKTEEKFTLEQMATMAAEATATGNAQTEQVLVGYTFSNAEGTDKVGTCTFDADTSDGTIEPYKAESNYCDYIPINEVAYSKGKRLTGLMREAASFKLEDAEVDTSNPQYYVKAKTIPLDSSQSSYTDRVYYVRKLTEKTILMKISVSRVVGAYDNYYDNMAQSGDVMNNVYYASNGGVVKGSLPLATGETAITLDADAKYTFSARQAFETGSSISIDKNAFLATLPVWNGGSY